MTHWQTILAVDFDANACAVYKANFPGVEVVCATVDPESHAVIDLFCGGGLASLGWHGRYWSL
jgi:site-specific DNA-cytosine methylase